MANEISKLITPDGVSHDIKDSVARQASYDVSNKVDKTGDSMTGHLALLGSELHLKTTSSSSNDSGDIVWFYGNGQEKARIWTDDASSDGRLNYRAYKTDGTQILSQRLATSGDVDKKVSKSGDTMTGGLNATFLTALASGSPVVSSKSTNVDASKANNNVSSTQYPAYYIQDGSGRILARLEGVIESSGNIGSFWYVSNYDTSGSLVAQKGIKMTVDKAGAMAYSIDDNGKFRNALGLATVAASGSYNDLTNKPTIPTKTSQLTNDTLFGYSNSISTNNTSDTWIPVFSGSSVQHRVLSTTFNGKSIDGGTNFSGAGIDGQHRILMVDQDGASIKQSCFRSKVMSWGSSTTLYCRRNSTAIGVVMLNTGSNTETFHIVCNGAPSSWKFRRIDSISNAYIAGLTAGIITKSGVEYAILYVQASSNFTMGAWFVTSNADNP